MNGVTTVTGFKLSTVTYLDFGIIIARLTDCLRENDLCNHRHYISRHNIFQTVAQKIDGVLLSRSLEVCRTHNNLADRFSALRTLPVIEDLKNRRESATTSSN